MAKERADWLRRGGWQVNLAQGLAAHASDGCIFRIIRDPLCAICIEAQGVPPTVDELVVLQARATAVFWTTERLVEALKKRSTATRPRPPANERGC